ncbi:MalY/PatB family protein [Rhodocyclus tenuis]|uniref:cysteine-S-conjugate beta-lyase n=1 Tax=Rhodocyclus tenuis TaxID=1066 RepID=A0A840GJD0_RHOTE|nr:PatB family C-S lyase [Rhodocyclus tenuis]MBB4248552.1 cystathionine beta-lyase [Rhodocyclus tenuis]
MNETNSARAAASTPLTASPLGSGAAKATSSFDFDRIIERRDGDSLKWNRYAGRDVLPLWVADMDFATPPAVLAAVRERVEHGILGYAVPTPDVVAAVVGHLERQYGWQVDPEWIVWLPGLVTGLNVACRAVDGGVLTATPVYPPFLSAPKLSGRALTTVPLIEVNGRWQFDFPALAAACAGDKAPALLLLCHPHNPVGRAWDEDELAQLADFCRCHDLIVCSDEIHCDLILDTQRRHQPFACIDEDAAARSITLMAPSKTYNIPGLGCAWAVISDPELRRRFSGVMNGIVPHVNVLGYAACAAALNDCEDWRLALIDYLRGNRDRVEAAVAAMPGVSMTHIEAGYLAWIDARALNVANPAAFFEAAGVGLNNGADFGLPGWVRLNYGCPRATLDAALARMDAACREAAQASR